MDEIENFDELLKEPEKLKEILSEKFNSLKNKEFNIEEDERYKEVVNKYKDVDIEKYNKLLEDEENNFKNNNPEEFKKAAEEKVKQQYAESLKKLQSQLEDKDKRLNEFSEKEKNKRLVDAFNKTLNSDKLKLKDDLVEDQLELFLNRFIEDEEGNIVDKKGIKNEKGETLTLSDYAESLQKNKASLFNNVKVGTGSTNQNTTANDGMKKVGVLEANKILREDPEKYKKLKENGMLDF